MDSVPPQPRSLRAPRAPARRVVALGGHEFSSRPPDRAVRDLLLGQATARAAGWSAERAPGPPRICLLPTASGDPADQSARFHAAFADCACQPSDLSLFRLAGRPVAMRDLLLEQDLIYVGGGSLVNLLAIWDAHDVDAVLRLGWQRGVVLAGQSAGAMCWFEAGVTKSWGRPAAAAGLGLLPGALCVHYHREPDRRAAFLAAVGREMPCGYGLDDYAGLIWDGRRMAGALSLREGAGAFRVATCGGQVVERALPARRISGGPAPAQGDDVSELRRVARMRAGGGRLR
jgi:dipeptidase E